MPPDDVLWTGQPSAATRRQIATLRALRVVTERLGISFMNTFAPLMSKPAPPRSVTRRLDVVRSDEGGWPVYTLRSTTPTPQTVVCVHGGGFTVEATAMHWRDYASIARHTNAVVVVPVYPLVPHGTAATVVPALADLILAQAAQPGTESVSVYADSAGGTLALSAAQELRRRGSPVPRSMVLISPWLDLALDNPACDAVDDPVLSLDELRAAGIKWADGRDLTDPMVSPMFGSLDGLPPTTIYAGSLDVLGPDALRLRDRAIADGADITFVLRRGLIHDWALPASYEGKLIRPQIYRQLLATP